MVPQYATHRTRRTAQWLRPGTLSAALSDCDGHPGEAATRLPRTASGFDAGDDDRGRRAARLMVVACTRGRDRQHDHQRDRCHRHLSGLAVAVRGVDDFFDAVMEAQRLGVAPPTMSVTELISGRNQLILTVATLGIGMLYHVGFLRWKSATPGKLLCGLRVVPVDRGHAVGPLPWSSILIRSAIWVLPSINSFLSLITVIDVLFPLWHPKRQALHDMAAKTQVVRLR